MSKEDGKTHKQELLDLAADIASADEVTVEKYHDDRAPANRCNLPKKYVMWITKALKQAARRTTS